jgi:hypothetical protein
MIRQAVRHIAWSVLGLSLVAWGASYFEHARLPLPGGGGLQFESGSVYRFWAPGPTTVVVPAVGGSPGVLVTANRILIRGGPIVPLWVPCMAAVITLWLVWRIGWERRQLARVGHCGACGYDLTGIDGVCPECGRTPC